MGMLEVFEPFRRQGIGYALEIAQINRELAKGHTPYAQIFTDNDKSVALQQKTGLKVLAIHDKLWYIFNVAKTGDGPLLRKYVLRTSGNQEEKQ